jgi:hypothetical protein
MRIKIIFLCTSCVASISFIVFSKKRDFLVLVQRNFPRRSFGHGTTCWLKELFPEQE